MTKRRPLYLGSAIIGILYDAWVAAAVGFCVAAEIVGAPAARHHRRRVPGP